MRARRRRGHHASSVRRLRVGRAARPRRRPRAPGGRHRRRTVAPTRTGSTSRARHRATSPSPPLRVTVVQALPEGRSRRARRRAAHRGRRRRDRAVAGRALRDPVEGRAGRQGAGSAGASTARGPPSSRGARGSRSSSPGRRPSCARADRPGGRRRWCCTRRRREPLGGRRWLRPRQVRSSWWSARRAELTRSRARGARGRRRAGGPAGAVGAAHVDGRGGGRRRPCWPPPRAGPDRSDPRG